MKQIKTAIHNTFSAIVLCLSLLVYTIPASSMDHSDTMNDHAMEMQMDTVMMDGHCDKMDKKSSEMDDDCCQDMDCDCMCMNITSALMQNYSVIRPIQPLSLVSDISSNILRQQHLNNPSPPPII